MSKNVGSGDLIPKRKKQKTGRGHRWVRLSLNIYKIGSYTNLVCTDSKHDHCEPRSSSTFSQDPTLGGHEAIKNGVAMNLRFDGSMPGMAEKLDNDRCSMEGADLMKMALWLGDSTT